MTLKLIFKCNIPSLDVQGSYWEDIMKNMYYIYCYKTEN